MNAHADKIQETKTQSVVNVGSKKQGTIGSTFQFVDNRPEVIIQRKLRDITRNSEQVSQLRAIQNLVNSRTQTQLAIPMQAVDDNHSKLQQLPIQKKENKTGLPDNLKSGIESLSGYSMDDVKVHYNSNKPAQLHAHAYAQGTNIHLGSGQEKHLPHEAWHVVQQKQGRVQPTMQMKGKFNINDNAGLETEADVMGAKALAQQRNVSIQQLVSVSGLTSKKMDAHNIVAQRTIWKLTDGKWEQYADGAGESAPPEQLDGYVEGQMVDTSPSLLDTRKKIDVKKTTAPKKKEDPFIQMLGGEPGGATALVVGIYAGDDVNIKAQKKEQYNQQKSIHDIYESMGINVFDVKGKPHFGGNMAIIKEGEEVKDKVGPTQARQWKETCVLIFNGHGGVNWFFGSSPGNEVVAVNAVSNWIRGLQAERGIVFKTIVLEGCHTAEELIFGDSAPHSYVGCPARLLSAAVSGVRVIGFNGVVNTPERKIRVADDKGEDVQVSYDSNAVVFLGGKVIKGEAKVDEGKGKSEEEAEEVFHVAKEGVEEEYDYYDKLFTMYRESHGEEKEKKTIYKTYPFK